MKNVIAFLMGILVSTAAFADLPKTPDDVKCGKGETRVEDAMYVASVFNNKFDTTDVHEPDFTGEVVSCLSKKTGGKAYLFSRPDDTAETPDPVKLLRVITLGYAGKKTETTTFGFRQAVATHDRKFDSFAVTKIEMINDTEADFKDEISAYKQRMEEIRASIAECKQEAKGDKEALAECGDEQ